MAWNRYVSWVTKPMTSPRLASADPAHVDAVDLHGARRSRRRGAARGRWSSSCPTPDGPTSATSWPGWTSKSMSVEARTGVTRLVGLAARRRPLRRPRPARLPSPRGRPSRRRDLSAAASSESSGRGSRRPWPARPGPSPSAGRRRCSAKQTSRKRIAPCDLGAVAGPRPPASSTIDGSMSRYSKIRSNSASAPCTSTWTLSSWPSGKNSRDWSVVKATMSPADGRVRVALDGQQPASQYTNAGRMAKIVPTIMKNQRPTMCWRMRQRRQLGVGDPVARGCSLPAARTSWPAGCR